MEVQWKISRINKGIVNDLATVKQVNADKVAIKQEKLEKKITKSRTENTETKKVSK